MSKRQFYLIIIYLSVLLALVGPASNVFPLGPIKDLRFLSPVLLIPFFFIKNGPDKATVNNFFKALFLLFFVVAIYTIVVTFLFMDSGLTYRNFVNLVLLFTPLIFVWGIFKFGTKDLIDRLVLFFFYAFTVLYAVELAKGGISLGAFLQVFQANLVTDSYFDTESGISLVMGFYFLFFLHKKKRNYAIAAALITILGAKRVAILGILICTFFYYFFPMKKISKSRKFYGYLFLAVGTLLGVVWDGIITGSFNEFIEGLTGVSANRFFMGRLNRFQLVFSETTEMPIYGLGLGLGYLENILYYQVGFASAFHGDFYRMYLEFGPLLFSIWLYITGKYASINKLALTATLLLIILLQTDNALLYNRVMFSYYFVMAYAIYGDKEG
ncbi:MAG: hypothetical protein ABJR05_10085 [Balneola sp.]